MPGRNCIANSSARLVIKGVAFMGWHKLLSSIGVAATAIAFLLFAPAESAAKAQGGQRSGGRSYSSACSYARPHVSVQRSVRVAPSRRFVQTRPSGRPFVARVPRVTKVNPNISLPRRSAQTLKKPILRKYVRQPVRSLPGNLALVNAGSRRNPGFHKPANIVHNPNHKAAKAGWQHGHRPFYFKHGGHRWRRVYYSFLAGGLWYWYW